MEYSMPNKTIYVADADVPIFERAQELAGDNLSSTIARALRNFINVEEGRRSGFSEITVRTGEHGTYTRKRFLGRELARRRTRDADGQRLISYVAYQTAKGRFAVQVREGPDWMWWSTRDWLKSGRKPSPREARYDWRAWGEAASIRLDVYETLEDVRPHVPPEMYDAINAALGGDEIEMLDI